MGRSHKEEITGPITAGMPHTHFVRGPSPVPVLVGKASNSGAASGRHLSVPPAAREALLEMAPNIEFSLD